MTRIAAFLLVRLVALLWVLALADIAEPLGAIATSLLIVASELILGYAWGKAETRFSMCKPKTLDPRRLVILMACVGVVESAATIIFLSFYAPWLIAWRIITAYAPFTIAEVLTFKRMCRIPQVARRSSGVTRRS